MRIVLYAPPISRPFLVERLGRLEGAVLTNATSDAEAIAGLAEADVLVMPQQYTTPELAKAINAAPNLEFVQLLTAGLEKFVGIKLPADVPVSSGSGGLAPTVAEHALALLLALARKLPQSLAHQGDEHWDLPVKGTMVSLFDKTVAVVGFGGIGREIARRLDVFGARVIGVSDRGVPDQLATRMYPASRIDEALAQADMIVLALPHSPGTYRLFDAARFEQCREGAFLVNVGRGSVVDSDALAEALQSGRLGGVAVDVTDPEPLPKGHPLWSAPNLIVTPHCAAGGGYPQLAEYVASNIARVQRKDPPLCRIELP